jgi:Na+/citrate or Na+/malate symporter
VSAARTLARVEATGHVEMACVAATVAATMVAVHSFARATEMAITAIMAGEVRTSAFMSAPATATTLIAIGCAVAPLQRVARIGGGGTGHASS